MTAEEIQAALEPGAVQAPTRQSEPSPVQPLGADLAAMEDTARSYAKRWGLVDEEGMIWCAQCQNALALMPSLHCGRCLGGAYTRLGIVQPWCVNRAQAGKGRAA